MGINLISDIQPKNAGAFPTHSAIYGKGGFQARADTTARDSIPALNRTEGMFVYVIDTNTLYRLGPGLGNGDWVVASGGSFSYPLAAPDGTAAAPSYGWASEAGLGEYRIGAGRLGFSVGTELTFEVCNNTITNVDPVSPAVVRFSSRIFPHAIAGVNETTGHYCKIDPSGADHHISALYVDITSAQLDTYGPAIKIMHDGSGDAVYCALFRASGSASEAASFSDGTKGFISTNQVAGHPNVVLFNALWEQIDVPNIGVILADNCTGHGLTIRKYNVAETVDGQAQIRIVEHDYTQHRFRVFNNGDQINECLDASVGAPGVNSPEIRTRAKCWDGAASQSFDGVIKMVVENPVGPIYGMRMYAGPAAGPFLSCIFRPAALDMQLNTIQNVSTIDGYTGSVKIRSNAGGTELLEATPTLATGETAMILLRREVAGGTYANQRVKFVDAATIVASGKQVLVIDN